jgi:hypothetical protein
MIDDIRLNANVPNDTIDYLSTQEIGVIISQGLSETYQNQPKNPVDFLGKWLLHITEIEQAKKEGDRKNDYHAEQVSNHEHKCKLAKVEQDDLNKELVKKDEKEAAFFTKVDASDDLEDNLKDLTDYLYEYTNSTSAYIAKLVPHISKIEEDDDDTAHIIENAPMTLDIYHVGPESFDFIKRKTIEKGEGIVHDIFNEVEEAPQADEDAKPVEGEDEGEGEKEVVKEEPKPQHVIVPDVVREPRIKYFKVPRLGSLLCIRLKYDSCLTESALDEAINDVYDCDNRKRQQEIEKAMWEEQENKRREEAEKLEQEFEEEVKEWEVIHEKEYITTPVDFAVCLDVTGQDRTYTKGEIETALKAVSHYAKNWTEREVLNLKKDVDRRIEHSEVDKEFSEKTKAKFDEIADRWVDQNMEDMEEQEKPKDGEEEPQSVENKPYPAELQKAHLKLEFKKKILNGERIEVRPESVPDTKRDDRRGRNRRDKQDESKNDESKDLADEEEVDYTTKWHDDIIELKSYKVIKMDRVLQSIFYFLKYSREDICTENTNKLNWKLAKEYINDDFFDRIRSYNPYGPKEDEYKEYQKINFILRNLEEVKQEDVDSYSLALGYVLKYIYIAVELRKADVVRRYQQNAKLRDERTEAEEKENERQGDRETFLQEERTKWEEEKKVKLEEQQKAKEGEGEGNDDEEDEDAEGEGANISSNYKAQEEQQFDEAEALARFDADRPPIVIPDEVIDDIDNDIELTEEDTAPATE